MLNEITKSVENAACLSDLRDALNALQAAAAEAETRVEDLVDICSLPVFGGAEPVSTVNIWSWDEDNLLTFEGNRYVIVSR